VKAAIADVPVGAVIEILATQPGAPADLRVWCKKRGHAYLGHEQAVGHLRVFVRKS
jgi:TusA-related sulfurtransferase